MPFSVTTCASPLGSVIVYCTSKLTSTSVVYGTGVSFLTSIAPAHHSSNACHHTLATDVSESTS
jgi:hypothetical protein